MLVTLLGDEGAPEAGGATGGSIGFTGGKSESLCMTGAATTQPRAYSAMRKNVRMRGIMTSTELADDGRVS